MIKIKKTAFCIFGMICLLGLKDLKGQTYYAFVSADEKYVQLRDDGKNKHQLIITDVFKITYCPETDNQKNLTLHDLKQARHIKSVIAKRFKEDYEYSIKEKPYSINYNFLNYQYFSSYDEANQEKKKLITKYKNDYLHPLGHREMSFQLPDCFKY